MKMKKTIGAILFVFGAALVNASPLHQMTVSNQAFNVLGGGRFNGTIDGHHTFFWCVDDQNFVYLPDAFHGYKTQVDDAKGTPTDNDYNTRFENATFAYTADNSNTNAEFRFRMAAYLVSRYNESLGGGDAYNQAIQSSIWKSTFLTPQNLTTVYNGTDFFTDAEIYVKNNYNSALFDHYRIASGFRGSSLADGGSDQVQTFLTAVPEPSTYALLGGGLLSMIAMRRRRANKA